MHILPETLKKLRLEKRLKQTQIAEIIGVNASVISAYETGLRQPSYDVLIKLANVYHVSIDFLFGRKEGRTIDASRLSDREITIIQELVDRLSQKQS